MLSEKRMSALAPTSPLAVLIVDHHADTRALYGEYLSRAGCAVEEASDGPEALAKAIARRHDVIVAETRLPGIDGYQLCQLLRRDAATRSTPLIIVTGDAMVADLERARSAGADMALVKPCLPEALFAEMCRLVTRQHLVLTAERRASGASDQNGDGMATADAVERKRPILSRVHHRGPTTKPPRVPPDLRCPLCDKALVYHHSNLGGVSARHPEQWDYFECDGECGTFEYRQRTRKVRRIESL
jgi:CheY-like chemotaxis protein